MAAIWQSGRARSILATCGVPAILPGMASWPEIPYARWKPTGESLHMWTQIVGKFRLAQTPWINHSWHVPLYVTARGLTTSPIHTAATRSRSSSTSSTTGWSAIPATAAGADSRSSRMPVAQFYARYDALARARRIPVVI